jgi:hypothetical protein
MLVTFAVEFWAREQTVMRVTSVSDLRLSPGRPNGSHAKLCGRGPRAEAGAARRLPRMTFGEPSREMRPP